LGVFPCLFQIPVEQVPARGAEVHFFSISVLDLGGRVHDAVAIPAMNQPETMTQFMQGRLPHTFQQKRLVRRLLVELGSETMRGNDRAGTLHLRHSEYVFQNRHEEINLGDSHELDAIRGKLMEKAAQDQRCIILRSSFVIGIFEAFHSLRELAREAAFLFNAS
jgi:hypothetical protein